MAAQSKKQAYKNNLLQIAKNFINHEYEGTVPWEHIGKGEKDKVIGVAHTTIVFLLKKLRLDPKSMNDLYIAEELKIGEVVDLLTDPYEVLLSTAKEAIEAIENESDYLDAKHIDAAKSQVTFILESAKHLQHQNEFVSESNREKLLNSKINFINECMGEYKKFVRMRNQL